MSHFLFPLPQPSVAIDGSKLKFPVRRIYCVGRNYAEHAREMGANPEREAPFFFCKPADAVVANPASIPFPSRTHNLHHEIELVVAINKAGSNISVSNAQNYIYGYAVGIDLTRRDLQAEAKKQGQPWDTAKGFDNSAPISEIVPAEQCGNLHCGEILLTVNGEVRQQGDIGDLIWSVPEIISELSTLFALAPGDLIFTGTPAGVGQLQPGDEVVGSIAGLPELRVQFIR